MLFYLFQYDYTNSIQNDLKISSSIFIFAIILSIILSIALFSLLALKADISAFFFTMISGLLILFGGIKILFIFNSTGVLNNAINPLRINYIDFLITNKAAMLLLAFFLLTGGLYFIFILAKYRLYIPSVRDMISYSVK